jgi:hypothetical protein
MTTEIMTPHSPRWAEFADRLFDLVNESGCDGDWGDVHQHAKMVLTTMDGIDIDGSLAFFKEHHGYCDCEILLNVEASTAHAMN